MTNSKLQLLGWNGVTLDYQSLQLALTANGAMAIFTARVQVRVRPAIYIEYLIQYQGPS